MHVEQLGELGLVHQPRLGEPAVRQAAVLGERHQLLDIGAKLLRLGGGGGDLLVLDERGRHVAEQGRAVARGALKLTSANTMAHGSFLSFVGSPYQVAPARQFFGGPRLPQMTTASASARRTRCPQADMERSVKVWGKVDGIVGMIALAMAAGAPAAADSDANADRQLRDRSDEDRYSCRDERASISCRASKCPSICIRCRWSASLRRAHSR